jgi:predicted outer membrane repeat protein
MKTKRARIALLSAAAALLVAPAAASAATITPNITTDEWAENAAACSLREAVAAAEGGVEAPNAVGCTPGTAGEDVIRLAPGTYELTIPADPADTLENGEGDLENFDALAIEALPGGPVTIDGNGHDRIFQTLGGGLRIDGVTLTGGKVDVPGTTAASTGGAIGSAFTLPVVLTDSALIGNSADGFGGAISSQNLSLTNVTVSGNSTSESPGGGISVSGTGSSLALDNVTITDNETTSNSGGGGVRSFAATVSVRNSIVAGNRSSGQTGAAPECLGTINSGGGNVVGSTAGCTFNAEAGDLTGAAPMLGPLAANGATTQTHALLADSPADGRGAGDCEPFDQRGLSRPASGCDAGAYEGPWARITATNPPSPASDNEPEVLGAAQTGSMVSVHDDAACAKPPLAEGSAEELAGGLTISVADESTTDLHVRAVDGLGVVSACTTEPFPYVHVLPVPEPPQGRSGPAQTEQPSGKRCRKGFKLKKVKRAGKKPVRKCVRVKKRR